MNSGWQAIAEGDQTRQARSILHDLIAKSAILGSVPSIQYVAPWTLVIGDLGQENVAVALAEEGWTIQQINHDRDSESYSNTP
jgi:hypothetical protein